MRNIDAYFDGACEPVNPGGTASWGFAVVEHGHLLYGEGKVIGHGEGMTNNRAEYHGLIQCLRYLNEKHLEDQLNIFGDSVLVVNMTRRLWGKKKPHKKAPHLLPLLEEAQTLLAKLPRANLTWIPREQNQLADWFSKQRWEEDTRTRQT